MSIPPRRRRLLPADTVGEGRHKIDSAPSSPKWRHFLSKALLAKTLRLVITGSSLEEAHTRTGVHRNSLRKIEHGLSDPKSTTIDRILSGYGIRPEMKQPLLDLFQRLSDLLAGAEPSASHPSATNARPVPTVPAANATGSLDELLAQPLQLDHPSLVGPDPAEQLSRLMAFAGTDRLLFASTTAEFHSDRLAIHACDCSYSAAECGAITRAGELAELALALAGLTERKEASVRGYAWAHLGNVRCLQARLKEAEAAFRDAAKLWSPWSKPAYPDAGRMLVLEASFCLAQRRPSEALDLLTRAAAVGKEPGRALLAIAAIEEALGHPEKALNALDGAETHLPNPDVRHRFLLHYLRALAYLDQPDKALPYSEEAITLAARLDVRADLLRALWLHARVTAALGQVLLAEDLFQLLRHEFQGERMHYELAIVSLELASILLKNPSPDEVKTLSGELQDCFAVLDLQPEAAAALQRFSTSLGRGLGSPATADHLATYLYRARHDRALPFPLSEPSALVDS